MTVCVLWRGYYCEMLVGVCWEEDDALRLKCNCVRDGVPQPDYVLQDVRFL